MNQITPPARSGTTPVRESTNFGQETVGLSSRRQRSWPYAQQSVRRRPPLEQNADLPHLNPILCGTRGRTRIPQIASHYPITPPCNPRSGRTHSTQHQTEKLITHKSGAFLEGDPDEPTAPREASSASWSSGTSKQSNLTLPSGSLNRGATCEEHPDDTQINATRPITRDELLNCKLVES